MELRSCNHLHFIWVAKDGLATKALNVYRGRPALKFKKVKDLYGTEDAKTFNPLPVFRPKVEFEYDEAESLHTLAGERTIKVDGETSESNIKGIDVGEREIDDHNFGNMTLKQIKERCKEKRRNASRYVGLSKETTETCSLGKGNHFNSQSEEDEYDMMEPLSCWKSRILNKMKTVRKGRNRSVVSSQKAISIVKHEEITSHEVIFQSNENLPAPTDVKVEVSELTSNCKDMIITAANSSFNCNKPETCCGEEPTEEYEAVNNYSLEAGSSMRTSEVPDTANGSVSETGISVITSEELTTNACGFETQMPTFFSNEPQYCGTNEEYYEYLEHEDPESIPNVKSSGGELLMEDTAEVISNKFSDFSLSEAKEEVAFVDQHPKNDSPETVSLSEVYIPVLHPETLPCVHESSWKLSSGIQVQVLDVPINNSPQGVELSKRNDSCLPHDETKDDTLHVGASVISNPGRECSAFWNASLHSSTKGSLDSILDDSPIDEKMRAPLTARVDSSRSCSTVIQLSIDEPVLSERVEDCHHSKMQHPPERLFSTRMAISPTSQKRLREAMVSTELDDEQYYRYARKLCYRKQNENKNGRLEVSSQIKRAEVIISPKKVVRKPKAGNNGFHQNDILKVPHPSCAVQGSSTGRTSVRSSSESAILFSQQQMRDIESVATKLAKELQFMKYIVEETLQSNVYPATSWKYSADEMRLAVQNATRVEESARRSLSVMARDCNRFCKIMKLAEKGSAASQNGLCKKRKIVFADEAGGKLCDVKTFEDDNGFAYEAYDRENGNP
ncbi:uncharacterized protein LOC110614894 isoform X2 [Manihot esculenta]|uniref:uncharacterized protein LOC110614894 isoform X2 n=1 Tax=Manihot esculenta TaxID=3983 RepID=UPI000B5D7901|nr:uncharacterized protein LOC110614894 isoform X2 [Manihot esculenta]